MRSVYSFSNSVGAELTPFLTGDLMPNAANITVKKNDGTTDIVWTTVSPSAGDSSPARWESQTVGTAMAHRPTLTHLSRDNGQKTARRHELQVVFPVVVTENGVPKVSDKLIVSVSAVIAKGAVNTDVNEAVSQAVNLFASTLIKDSLKSGYAAS